MKFLRMWARAGVIVAAASATLFVSPLALADSDTNDTGGAGEPTLAACQPGWDPTDDRIATWDGRTLHDEPASVRDIYWRTWQQPNLAMPEGPTQAELDAGVHLRRWRWEYECAHPAQTNTTETDGTVSVTHCFGDNEEPAGGLADASFHCHIIDGEVIDHEHIHEHTLEPEDPPPPACLPYTAENHPTGSSAWHCHVADDGEVLYHQHGDD